jgi:hypothetical protein
MAVCPRCRSEYRAEFTRCASCDVDLVDPATLPPELAEDDVLEALAEEENLVSVSRGTVEWCKEIQRKLLARQIPAIARRADDVLAAPGQHLVLEVVIREEDSDRAAEVFNQELLEKLERDGLLGELAQLHAARDRAEQPASDGAGDVAAEGPAAEEAPLACPACGSTKKLKKGKCRKCGLFLGEE